MKKSADFFCLEKSADFFVCGEIVWWDTSFILILTPPPILRRGLFPKYSNISLNSLSQ